MSISKTALKVVAISDTHGLHDKLEIPDGDILIHAGDIGTEKSWPALESFARWIESLPHPHKIVIAGNHDFLFENSNAKARAMFRKVIYLQDEAIEIEGYKIYGSPWQPKFGNWAFNLPRGDKLAQVWSRIPPQTNILVTHGPPQGICDRTIFGVNAGCRDLLDRIKVVKPLAHIFGHIHEGYGNCDIDGTKYINASVVNLQQGLTNPPIVFEIGSALSGE